MDTSKQDPHHEDLPILLNSLEKYFCQFLPELNEKALRFRIVQFFSSLILPLTFSFEVLQDFYSYDVQKEADRQLYVDMLLSSLVPLRK